MNVGIIVMESPEGSKTEWGISFGGYTPDEKEYFKMPDKETAFRLKDYLTERSIIHPKEPVDSRPTNPKSPYSFTRKK